MKYYSEKLRKFYDTERELVEEEKSFDQKKATEAKAKEERVARAKEVEKAYENYLNLRKAFVKDYGSYHMTYTDKDEDGSVISLFDHIFGNLF